MPHCPICKTKFVLGTKYCSCCGCNLSTEYLIDPVCPVCKKHYPDGARYCDDDGAKLTTTDKLTRKCPVCGTVYSDDTKYCPNDGTLILSDFEKEKGSGNSIATKSERFLAYLIDGIVSSILSVPTIIFCLMALAETGNYFSDDDKVVLYFVMSAILYILPLTYVFIKDGLNGQSIGKRMMKIQVVNIQNNKKCTIGTSCLRALITCLLQIIPVVGWLVEPIMVLSKEDGRRLADKVANTQVVKV